MDDNPYAPPSARVADHELAPPLERPPIVSRAVYLLWASFALIFPSTIYDILYPEPETSLGENLLVFAFVLGATGAISYWLNVAAWKGEGYARWVLAALSVISYTLILWIWLGGRVFEYFNWPWYIQLFEFLSYVADMMGVVMLFAPGANAWYRQTRARR
jgi:hypothetical protein